MHPNMKLMVRWLDSVFSQWISSTIFSIILLKALLNFLNLFTFLLYFFVMSLSLCNVAYIVFEFSYAEAVSFLNASQ